MGARPEHGLVVEVVKFNAAAAGCTILARQVGIPAGNEGGADSDAGIERIVAGDQGGAVWLKPVAAIGCVGCRGLLSAITARVETAVARVRAARALWCPANERQGEQ